MPLPELQLIERIRQQAVSRNKLVHKGIGDDCAILRVPKGRELLVTTDLSLEGTHFRRDWHPADSVGHRCLARGLSDIAAMGGEPIAAFLSLAVEESTGQEWVDDFMQGFTRLAARHKVELAGGDVSESQQGIAVDVMVVGSVPQSRAVLRSGARPGDALYVTGCLGASAAALTRLQKSKRVPLRVVSRSSRSQADRHFYPEPRVAIGRYLREKRLVHAMIDISDGLSTDLMHICKASGVNAALLEPLIPIAQGATLAQALHGGEDYELLFTASEGANVFRRIGGVPVTQIGWLEKTCTRNDQVHMLQARGWEHFKKNAD